MINPDTPITQVTVGQLTDYLVSKLDLSPRPASPAGNGAAANVSKEQLFDQCEACGNRKKRDRYRKCWSCAQTGKDKCPICSKWKSQDYSVCYSCNQEGRTPDRDPAEAPVIHDPDIPF